MSSNQCSNSILSLIRRLCRAFGPAGPFSYLGVRRSLGVQWIVSPPIEHGNLSNNQNDRESLCAVFAIYTLTYMCACAGIKHKTINKKIRGVKGMNRVNK